MQMKKMKHFLAAFTALVMVCIGSITASAYSYDDLPEGIHQIKTELSCYVNAMGGVEFGAPLLTFASVEVSADGNKTMTLYFAKNQVTIYGITCDTFIDVSPSYITETNGISSGTLGYYNADGTLVTDSVTYTLSEDTAENAQKEQVHYVDSVSFPVDHKSDTYYLTLFVNSNVMGTQFTKDGYAAVLTVDWESVSSEKDNEPETEEPSKETNPALKPENVENRDGLNIYHPEEDETPMPNQDQSATGTYIAFFKKPILFTVGIAAVALILIGGILVLTGKKENKS